MQSNSPAEMIMQKQYFETWCSKLIKLNRFIEQPAKSNYSKNVTNID